MNDLSNRIVLITGSTSGIGRASAIRFAIAGAVVVVSGRNEKKGNNVVHEIEEIGGKAVFLEMDVTSREAVQVAAEIVKRKFGRLDALFCNAVVGDFQSIEDIDYETSMKCIDTNLFGVVFSIQAFLPMLLESKGVILNNASICGLKGFHDELFLYSAVKAGIIKLSKSLAKKYAGQIRVNVICPGSTRTDIFPGLDYDELAQKLPVGMVTEPEDVAAVANFLISVDAKQVNGAVLTVDGGQSL